MNAFVNGATINGTTISDPNLVYWILGAIASVFVFVLLYWVLLVVARWKMFTKAGEAGWKSIIPIYADYIGFKLWWDTKNFWILFLSGLVSTIASMNVTYTVNDASGTFGLGQNPVATVIAIIAFIVSIVWIIRWYLKTAKAYGKGAGMGVLMIFFPNIITLILGFGSAQYVGPQK